MNYNYYIADVFTRQIFNGAQIAVFPNAEGLSDEQMRLLARELNLTETVFVFHPESGSTKRKMRIFSPLGEIDFAGHPIIATAYVLGSCGDIDLTEALTHVVFEQNAGPIDVNITANRANLFLSSLAVKFHPSLTGLRPPMKNWPVSYPSSNRNSITKNTRLAWYPVAFPI